MELFFIEVSPPMMRLGSFQYPSAVESVLAQEYDGIPMPMSLQDRKTARCLSAKISSFQQRVDQIYNASKDKLP